MTVTGNLHVTVRIVNALNLLPESILKTLIHKTFSASGGLRPPNPFRDSATPLGTSASDPLQYCNPLNLQTTLRL